MHGGHWHNKRQRKPIIDLFPGVGRVTFHPCLPRPRHLTSSSPRIITVLSLGIRPDRDDPLSSVLGIDRGRIMMFLRARTRPKIALSQAHCFPFRRSPTIEHSELGSPFRPARAGCFSPSYTYSDWFIGREDLPKVASGLVQAPLTLTHAGGPLTEPPAWARREEPWRLLYKAPRPRVDPAVVATSPRAVPP